jgi:hypothetical protein
MEDYDINSIIGFYEAARGEDTCDYTGHEYEDAGGGLLICMNCFAEKWTENSRIPDPYGSMW